MKKLNSHGSSHTYDVIIIGGGATGAGTARDCSLRGLSTLLVERHDFASGATGRNHGLLHSGVRYAVTDPESATECISENRILRRIARHCVEPTGGLAITLPEDSLEYQSSFVRACLAAGIEAEEIDPAEALRIEPAVNPSLIGAVRVPDGAVDPFRLTIANIVDAQRHNCDIITNHEVIGLLRDSTRIVGVRLRDSRTSAESCKYANVVINAAGIWAAKIAAMADAHIKMVAAKGSLLIFGHRVNNVVINRCRRPADADILVPGDTISLIGTTSVTIPYDEIDQIRVTADEVDLLRREGAKLAPRLDDTRILRAYCGVRPLVSADNDPSSRSISRGIVCLDHSSRDGIDGLITITGGKLMTYRLMAEWATDMACSKLGVTQPCTTADVPLPGSEETAEAQEEDATAYAMSLSTNQKAAVGRHGTMSEAIEYGADENSALVCECEQVSVGEIKYALDNLHADNLVNLRRRTRIGMGTCQGEMCACRAAGLMQKKSNCTQRALADLRDFINERWKGMYPVGWGESLIEGQFMSWIYGSVCGLDRISLQTNPTQPPTPNS